jgi:hypothetical protein
MADMYNYSIPIKNNIIITQIQQVLANLKPGLQGMIANHE